MIDENDFLSAQTDDITVSACSVLMDAEKSHSAAAHLWGYYLCIENNSCHKIHLVGKDWNITDDKGNRFSDTSMGFKGEIPELEPGECFEYTSTAPIDASNAVFYGCCKIKKEGQETTQEVKIPTFYLSSNNAQKNSSIH